MTRLVKAVEEAHANRDQYANEVSRLRSEVGRQHTSFIVRTRWANPWKKWV
jgi:hypothetical protein